MNISSIIKQENILCLTECRDQHALLSMLIKTFETTPDPSIDPQTCQQFLPAILEREQKGSTAIGNRIAFPHARLPGLSKPLAALALIEQGIAWQAPDDLPVKLVLLFLFPAERHEIGVKIQAVFARFLSVDENLERILTAANPQAIYQTIEQAALEIDTPVCAQDLMSPLKITLDGDMLLQDATCLMNAHKSEVAAVVDQQEQLLGEIDCIHLFQLPDYITKLNSMPPIRDFDPFEKYFTENSRMRVADVMNTRVAIVQPGASLMEIIFFLAVKKHLVVYVCQGRRLLGAIDRITVLNKIFNL